VVAAVLSVIAVIVGLSMSASASAASNDAVADFTSKFQGMPDQTYALCAGARSLNFDGVTYAKCRRKEDNSLAMSHDFPGGDAFSANKMLTASGSSVVSTDSPPSPKRYAVYECSCPIVYTKKPYHVNGPAQFPTTRAAYDKVCGSGSRADMTADGTILRIGSGGPAATQHEVDNRIYDDLFGTTTP
jgi:hypothetical protein